MKSQTRSRPLQNDANGFANFQFAVIELNNGWGFHCYLKTPLAVAG
jgi:hypothetical protein